MMGSTNTMAPPIETELDQLPELDVYKLRELWEQHYCCPAPPMMSRRLLSLAVGYRIQERAFGRLSDGTQKKLAALGRRTAPDENNSVPNKPTAPRIRRRFRYKAGTRLLREWKGVTHEVVVVEGGDFMHNGQRFKSLSHIARTITGTKWSGPAFFGVLPQRGVAAPLRRRRKAGAEHAPISKVPGAAGARARAASSEAQDTFAPELNND